MAYFRIRRTWPGESGRVREKTGKCFPEQRTATDLLPTRSVYAPVSSTTPRLLGHWNPLLQKYETIQRY